MLIIDANDYETIQEYEYQKRELAHSKKNKGTYEVDDFVLIRTTDYLDSSLTLKALCDVPFVTNTNSVPNSAMFDILKEKNNVNVYDEDIYEEFRQLVYLYSPLSTQYRSTIHFTLNGLVSSHSKGNFDNQNFIVIDKLSKHLGKDDFRSIRMEDTFVFEKFKLSEDAIIMINYDKYQKLLAENPWMKDMPNIVVFKGDEKIATEIILTKMGIMPEKIETHSSEYTERTPMHQSFFEKVKNMYGIEQMKHNLSPEYQSDDEKNLKLWQIYNENFYTKLFEFFVLEENRKKQMMEYLLSDRNDRWEKADLLKSYILEVGIENYQKFVLDYNNQIKEAIAMGKYPTNKSILDSNQIIIGGKENKVR